MTDHPGPGVASTPRPDPADQVRAAYAAGDGAPPAGEREELQTSADGAGASPAPGADEATLVGAADPEVTGTSSGDLQAGAALAEERLADLQRLQAEFVNYRRRVERDRTVARDTAVSAVLEALLPVLDDVHLAREHGDLEGGPFAAIADKLEAVLGRFGLARYGQPGEPFDPTVHEALVRSEVELAAGTTETTVVQVLQPGYRMGADGAGRVLRAARVAVADPQS